jgi:hypothetical protein
MKLFFILSAMLFTSVCIFLSCASSPQKSSTPQAVNDASQCVDGAVEVTIDILDLENDKIFSMDDIADSILYVKLETTDASLIGEITQIEYFDGKYFVLDESQTQSLFVFDSVGRYLWKISRIGGGPGEYISLDEFSIDYQNRRIHLLSLNPSKVMVFDFQNSFIEEKKMPFYTQSFVYLPNNGYLFYNSYSSNTQELKKEYNLIVTDTSMNIIRGYLPYSSAGMQNSVALTFSNYYKYNRKIHFVDNFNSRVYSIEGDSLYARYQFNFGSHAFDVNRLADSEIDYEAYLRNEKPYRLNSVCEIDDAIYLTIHTYGKVFFCCYSKESKKLTVGNAVQSSLLNLVSAKVLAAQANYFISIVSPESLYEVSQIWKSFSENERQQAAVDENVKKILTEYRDDDNPILSVFKIK